MKKSSNLFKLAFKSFAMSVAIIGLSASESRAQWSGSPINTFTDGRVGIGLTPGPASNASLEIENEAYPSHLGPFIIFPDFPATRISRRSYFGPTLPSGKMPSNIFEIYQQMFDEATRNPTSNNNPVLIVDYQGNVGINKLSPGATFDVGGNVQIDQGLNVGTNAAVGGNAKVDQDLTVGASAVISNNVSAGGNVMVGNQLHVTGGSTFNMGIHVHTDAYFDDGVQINSLTGPTAGLALINTNGQVMKQNVPTLTLGGSTLTLSNGGSINSSVTLPTPATPAGDNLGNHTATKDLNMSGKNIVGTNTIYSDNTITKGLDLMYGTHLSGRFIPVLSGGFDYMTKFEGHMAINKAPSASYDLACNGNIIAPAYHTVSDRNFKKNISSLNKIKDKVFQLGTYQYNYNKNATKDFKFDDKIHFGFIAQEIQSVFPNLTSEIDSQGHLAVNYIEIIPLLLQVLKEEDVLIQSQGKDIEVLKKEIELLKNAKQGSTTNIDPVSSVSGSKLAQNVPNPFGRETKIGFSLSNDFQQGFIGIYNLNGQEVRKINVQKEQTEITINADQLEAGMYVYSLIVNNNLIDSKKMVISK